jgi:hypothetical protein
MKLLGRLQFPNSPFYVQRKKLQQLMAAIVMGLTISVVFVLIALKQDSRFGH